MSTQKATNINNLIISNLQAFTIGNVMTAAQWRTLVASIFALPRSVRKQQNQMSYINSYVAVNRVLRKRGMVVRSSGYYTQFTVTGLDAARTHASHMIQRGKAILTAANELQANIPTSNRRYRFTSLKQAELQSVGRYITKPLNFK